MMLEDEKLIFRFSVEVKDEKIDMSEDLASLPTHIWRRTAV